MGEFRSDQQQLDGNYNAQAMHDSSSSVHVEQDEVHGSKIGRDQMNVQEWHEHGERPLTRASQMAMWILLLIVPLVALALNWQRLQAQPLLSLTVLSVWALWVALGWMVVIMWLEPESRQGKAIREGIRRRFEGYEAKYLENLIYLHRNFDVKGLSTQGSYKLSLQHVFVELQIAPQLLHTASADPIRRPGEPLKGQQPIWDFLRSEQDQHLAIIGAPGSGKTTLLRHVALVLSSGRKVRRIVKLPARLPILLFLREHGGAIITNAQYSLPEAISSDLKRHGGPEAPEGWFATQLAKGRCLVLLDGLDEVAEEIKRRQVSNWVDRQIQQYGKKHNRFVITSRPHGYRTSPLDQASALLEVQPFTQEQVEQFVHNWYLENEIMSQRRDDRGVQRDARQGANDLLRRLQNTPTLAALAVNPLLLTMIATVHRYRSSLPGRRVELYAEVCEVFLGKHQAVKGLAETLTPAQKKRVLQVLALHLMKTKRRELPKLEAIDVLLEPLALVSAKSGAEAVEEFLGLVESGSGLLLQREAGVYGFAHLAFQEYLAAVQIVETKDEEILIVRIADEWWRETIQLYAAQSDASGIIRACLNTTSRLPVVPALVLARQCIDEAHAVQPKLRDDLRHFFTEGVEAKDPDQRKLVAEALMSLRVHSLVRIDEKTKIDPQFVTHAEYQLFLDEMRAKGKQMWPDHWSNDTFPVGQGLAPVSGVRSAHAVAFCAWFSARKLSEGWRIRLPEIEELTQYRRVADKPDVQSIGQWIKTDTGYQCLLQEGTEPSLAQEKVVQAMKHDITAVLEKILAQADEIIASFVSAMENEAEKIEEFVTELSGILILAHAITGDPLFDQMQVSATSLPRKWTNDLPQNRPYVNNLRNLLDSKRQQIKNSTDNFTQNRIHDLTATLEATNTLSQGVDFDTDFPSFQSDKAVDSQDVEINKVQNYKFYALPEYVFIGPRQSEFGYERINAMESVLQNYYDHSKTKSYLGRYVNFLKLEERKAGRLNAWEGIRLVWEREERIVL